MRSRFQRLRQTALSWLPQRVQARMRGAHAAHKSVLRGIAWLSLFVLAAKGLAALKEVAVAYRFGTSEVLEGYLLAFNLASYPISLLFSVMHFALVPASVRRQTTPDGGRAWQRQVAALVWLAAAGASMFVAATLPPLIRNGWLGLTPGGREAALVAVPWLAATTVLGILASWHACQLMSRQRHIYTFLEAIPAVGILGAVLLVPSAVVQTLLWGTLVGFAAQWALLMVAVRTSGQPVVPRATTTWPLDGALAQTAGCLLSAQLVISVGSLIDQIILAHLPAGSLVTFSYANRVMALVLALTSTVVGRAFLPVLSEFSNAQDSLSFLKKWGILSLWLGLALSSVFAISSNMIIGTLFERGAFNADDTIIASHLLAAMSFQLPFYALHVLLWQWYATFQIRGRHILLTAFLAFGLKYVGTAFAIHILNWDAGSVIAGEYIRLITICLMLGLFIKRAAKAANKNLSRHQ